MTNGLAERMARHLMQREGLLTKVWTYDYGVVWRGMEALYAHTGSEDYLSYIRDAMDSFVDDSGGIRGYRREDYNLDNVCGGRQLLFLYQRTGERKYRLAADRLREQLATQPRTSDGGFWHKQIYPYQMWLDGLHMAMPFYIEYSLMTGDRPALEDAAEQFLLAYRHTLDPESGLNRHAWDEKRVQDWADPGTGRSAHAWGRAIGWYMVGLADALELLPRDLGGYSGMLEVFNSIAGKMLSVRREGVWEQVVDCPGRPGNYLESSCACMMVYSLLKGARLGLLPGEYGKAAMESYEEIIRKFVFAMKDGRLFLAKCCQVAGLGGAGGRDGSFAYYVSEPIVSYDLKGTGAFIQAACEAETAHAVR